MATRNVISVDILDGDSVNWALKKFKRQCDSYGIIKEYRKRKEFKKPSIQKKEKLEAALKRKIKEERKKVRRYSKI